MGHGIAQLFALSGFQVTLNDVSLEILEKAIPRIQDNLHTCIKHGVISADEAEEVPGRITITTDLDKAASQADFVIEAVVETAMDDDRMPRGFLARNREELLRCAGVSSTNLTDETSN